MKIIYSEAWCLVRKVLKQFRQLYDIVLYFVIGWNLFTQIISNIIKHLIGNGARWYQF